MTNVPTITDIFELFVLPFIISFIVAFIIHYFRFKDLKKGLYTGIFSIELLFLLIILFFAADWKYLGLISGILAGSIKLFT